jgi:hypothetical protein
MTTPVERGLEIIEPDPERWDACRRDIQDALTEIYVGRTTRDPMRPKTKREREASKRLASALRRVQIAAASADVDPVIYTTFPHLEIHSLIKFCDRIERDRARLEGRDEPWKVVAVIRALFLLENYGREVTTTKGSRFPRLAALLAGEPKADRTYLCREVLRPSGSAERGSR